MKRKNDEGSAPTKDAVWRIQRSKPGEIIPLSAEEMRNLKTVIPPDYIYPQHQQVSDVMRGAAPQPSETPSKQDEGSTPFNKEAYLESAEKVAKILEGEGSALWPCPLCPSLFQGRNFLKVHLEETHAMDDVYRELASRSASQTPSKHIHKHVIPVESRVDKGSDSYQSMTTGTYFPATPDRIYVTKLACECGSEVER